MNNAEISEILSCTTRILNETDPKNVIPSWWDPVLIYKKRLEVCPVSGIVSE